MKQHWYFCVFRFRSSTGVFLHLRSPPLFSDFRVVSRASRLTFLVNIVSELLNLSKRIMVLRDVTVCSSAVPWNRLLHFMPAVSVRSRPSVIDASVTCLHPVLLTKGVLNFGRWNWWEVEVRGLAQQMEARVPLLGTTLVCGPANRCCVKDDTTWKCMRLSSQ